MRVDKALRYICTATFWCLIFQATSSIAIGAEISGDYVAVENHRTSMTVTQNKGEILIKLKGGGQLHDTEAISADCEAVAAGRLVDGVIHAKLIPFDGEVSSLDEVDIKQLDPVVIISFTQQGATVRGTFAHCGLRNKLSGKYKKR